MDSNPALDMIILDEKSISPGEDENLHQAIARLVKFIYLPVIAYGSADARLRPGIKQMTTNFFRRPYSLTRLYRIVEEAFLFAGVATRPSPLEPEMNILIADDDPISRAAILLHLDHLGYRADSTMDGDETLVALAQKNYQLLIIDMHMGTTDGLSTTRAIRETLPTDKQPFIAILTAGVTPAQLGALQNAGMDAYIEKPVSIENLRQLLERTRLNALVSPSNLTSLDAHNQSPGSEPSRFNLQVLNELLNLARLNKAEKAANILDLFFQTAPGIMQEIKVAAHNQHLQKLKEKLHALRGSCEIYGAIRLSQLCKKLEKELDREIVNNIPQQIAAIEAEFTHIEAILRTYQSAGGD